MRPADQRPAHGGYPTALGDSDRDLARAWHDAHRAAHALAAAQFPNAMGTIAITPTALGRFIVVPLLVVEYEPAPRAEAHRLPDVPEGAIWR